MASARSRRAARALALPSRAPAATGHVGVSQAFELTRRTTAFASRAYASASPRLAHHAEAGNAPRTYLLEVGGPLVARSPRARSRSGTSELARRPLLDNGVTRR